MGGRGGGRRGKVGGGRGESEIEGEEEGEEEDLFIYTVIHLLCRLHFFFTTLSHALKSTMSNLLATVLP